MNRKREGLPEPNTWTSKQTNLIPSSLNAPQQFVAKLHLLLWQRFERDEKVNKQAAPP
jgi:hypothetical protein